MTLGVVIKMSTVMLNIWHMIKLHVVAELEEDLCRHVKSLVDVCESIDMSQFSKYLNYSSGKEGQRL